MTATSETTAALATRDGIEVAYSVSGDASPNVLFVHATGFNKEVCYPVIEEARTRAGDFRALALDQRAHGDSAAPEPPFDWWDVGRDLVELVGASGPVIGVGHSAGGAELILAELTRPGTFDSLLLVEPIIFPPPYGRFPENPMSAGARRRKRGFTDRQAAYENFAAKEAFAGWDRRAMQAYVDGGLRPDAAGVVLKCDPEHEAEFFMAATEHGAWDRLGEVTVPCVVVAGEHSTTHRDPYLSELTGRIPDATSVIVPDASHFVWMEKPATIGSLVADLVDQLRTSG